MSQQNATDDTSPWYAPYELIGPSRTQAPAATINVDAPDTTPVTASSTSPAAVSVVAEKHIV